MPTPLTLSDDATEVLHQLAAPIAFNRRDEFLQAVADVLAAHAQPGVGLVHRVARDLQRDFTLEARRETELPDRPRHLAARTALLRV
jgi:hypothetical protein